MLLSTVFNDLNKAYLHAMIRSVTTVTTTLALTLTIEILLE